MPYLFFFFAAVTAHTQLIHVKKAIQKLQWYNGEKILLFTRKEEKKDKDLDRKIYNRK